MTDRRARRRT